MLFLVLVFGVCGRVCALGCNTVVVFLCFFCALVCAFSCAGFWSLWSGLCSGLQSSCGVLVLFLCSSLCFFLVLVFGVCGRVCALGCKTVVVFLCFFVL